MSNLPHAGNIEMLRDDLRHFEETGDFGDPTVMEIKAHLQRRITELDAALCRVNMLQTPEPPTTADPR